DDPDHEYTSAVVASDAKIYFAGPHLYAINPDGTLAWKLSLLATGWTSPTIAPDGTLYFGEFSWSGKPSDPAEGLITAVKTGSQGFAASAWPKYRHDANNAGVE
ncbi:MAG TPA: hypothetical protein VL137_15185, partial [Polyangiaceae bacterium]|nr:hypothetical protein [Polyangiaceae bacterium]